MVGAVTIGQSASLAFEASTGALKLSDTKSAPTIVIDVKDWSGVTRTGNDLTIDIDLVTGVKGKVATSVNGISNTSIIVAGTIGKSSIIDSMVSSGTLDVSAISGKWEFFISQLVLDPFEDISSALATSGERYTPYMTYLNR